MDNYLLKTIVMGSNVLRKASKSISSSGINSDEVKGLDEEDEVKGLDEEDNSTLEMDYYKNLQSEELIRDFKNVPLLNMNNGIFDFKHYDDSIHIINILFKYEMDIYKDALIYFVHEIIYKMKLNKDVIKDGIYEVNYKLIGRIKNKFNDIIMSDISNVMPHKLRLMFLSYTKLTYYELRLMFLSNIMLTQYRLRSMFSSNKKSTKKALYIKEKEDINCIMSSKTLFTSYYRCFENIEFKDILMIIAQKDLHYDHLKDLITQADNLRNNGTRKFTSEHLEIASKYGNITMAKIFFYYKAKPKRQFYNNAAKYGNLNMLKYMNNEIPKCYKGEYMCANAAENGNLECLEYLYNNGFKFSEVAATNAGKNVKDNVIDIAMFIISKKPELIKYMVKKLIVGGKLSCLKLIYDYGHVWSLDDLKYSRDLIYVNTTNPRTGISKRCLDCLYFLRDNGYPFKKDIFVKLPPQI